MRTSSLAHLKAPLSSNILYNSSNLTFPQT